MSVNLLFNISPPRSLKSSMTKDQCPEQFKTLFL